MTPHHIETVARMLDSALTDNSTAPLVSAAFPDFHLDHAYDVSHRWSELRLHRGSSIFGYKVGLTSKASQQRYGAEQPMYGMVFAEDVVWSNDGQTVEIPLHRYRNPRIELELAFRLHPRIASLEDTSLKGIQPAIASVIPAIEIVGERCVEGGDAAAKRTLVDIVADNGLFCGAVLGREATAPVDVSSLTSLSVTLDKNGERVAEGHAASVLGNPVSSLVWLASKLHERGESLCPNQVVLSGSMTPPLAVVPGDQVLCNFGDLGRLQVRFS